MSANDLIAKKSRALQQARSIASSPEFLAGDSEAERGYQKAVADARRYATEADTAQARAKMGSVIWGQGGGAAAASGPEVRDLVRPINPERSLVQRVEIPFPQLRTEYPLLATDASYTYGSRAVPTSMADAIVEALVDESGVLAAGPRILRTVSGEELDLPFVGTLPTASYRSEGAAATQSTPVIGQAVLNAWNISGWVTASDAFLRDATGSAESIIGTMCGQSLGVKLATELASGDGAPGHMVGYFDNAVAGKTTASSTNFTMDECLQLRGSLKPAARKGAKWVVSDAAHQILILMKDDNASYVVQPSTQAGFPDRLWGDELHVCAYGPAVTSGLKPIVYGRPDRAFFVRFVGPIEVQRSDNVGLTEYTSWLSVFRFQIIADSVFVDTAAAKSLLMK